MALPLVRNLLLLLVSALLAGCWESLSPPVSNCRAWETRCADPATAEVCDDSGRYRLGQNCAVVTPYTANWVCCLSSAREHRCLPRADCLPGSAPSSAPTYQLAR